MSRGFNFSAGPATLPTKVLERARDELLEYGAERASVMEISHRSKAFERIAAESEADLRALLAIPDDYAVLFLQGGATQQFALLPMNLAGAGDTADYVLTGLWGEKAAAEAKPHVGVNIAATAAASNYTGVPDPASWALTPGAAYLHLTPNETIQGVEMLDLPALPAGHAPIVADLSSTILSRPLDISRYGVIYAGAQKNIGPAGLVVMIIRRDLLERAGAPRAKILRYADHAANQSLFNTPPTFSWYLAGQVFKWVREQGGVEAMAAANARKASTLYAAIDGSGGFYTNPVEVGARSWMNVPFVLADAALDKAFLAESEAAGLLALKGHKSVGGMRASLYNAMPQAGVDALVAFMRDFQQRHG